MDQKSKKRLAMILPSAYGGGSERVFLNLLKEFDRSTFEIHLILIDPSGPYLSAIPSDIRVYGLGYSRVARSLPKLVKIIRNINPDLIFSTIVHLNLAVLLIKPFFTKKTKVFVRESNIPSRALSFGCKETIFRRLYRILYSKANGIVCPGEYIKRDLENTFSIDPKIIAVIPNPVDVDSIITKMKLGKNCLIEDRVNLVAAGSLTRQKGFDVLIKALAEVLNIRKDIHLTIIGEGQERNHLENQIMSLGIEDFVTLKGFVENPYPYFFEADLFILSSRWEGLPNVVLEALACGTPVVAVDCPGSTSEIFEDPSQGSLVSGNDVASLSSAIEDQLKKRQKEAKKSLLPKRFDIRTVARCYEAVLTGNEA
jgi:glycosyltransferase involved in cell wall biosynthesis